MRILIVIVAALALFVAYAAATTQRRELPRVTDITTTGPRDQAKVAATTTTGFREGQTPAAMTTSRGRPAAAPSAGPATEGITIEQAASRIAATGWRPSIVLLYGTRCPLSRGMLTEFAALVRRHPEVDVHAFAIDEEYADELPDFLREHNAAFSPVYIREWPAGALTAAMGSLGIEAGVTWTAPLVAVRNVSGKVTMQGEAMTDVAAIERALAQLR